MNEIDSLARQFEQQRPRLRSVAYRIPGLLSEAEDAVREAWFRLSRADASRVGTLPRLVHGASASPSRPCSSAAPPRSPARS
ncbi:hypothetical protein [Kitasatospora sp. NPDC050467]|uniref:hypothetical protein n=1 Tax=unclassified Kitasatospora TaxID=2633591 RepID=UPI00379BF7B2